MPAGRFAPRWSQEQKTDAIARVLEQGESINAAHKATGIPYSTVRALVREEEERRSKDAPAPDRVPDRFAELCDRIAVTLKREVARLDTQAARRHELNADRLKRLADATHSLGRAISTMPQGPKQAGEPDETRPASSLVAALEDADDPQPMSPATTGTGRPAPSPTPGSGEHGQGNGGASGQGVIVRASDLAAELEAERARAG